jgi:hypothetical protein
MARLVDSATGASTATGLYNRYYRPTFNLALHADAASLLRHVRVDGRVARRPSRESGRRSPVRIADACPGALTAALADRARVPSCLVTESRETLAPPSHSGCGMPRAGTAYGWPCPLRGLISSLPTLP